MFISSESYLKACILCIILGFFFIAIDQSDWALACSLSGTLHFIMYYITKKKEEEN